jgi:hypothetical protein
VRPIDVLDDVSRLQRFRESRPPGAAVEIVGRRKQWLTRYHVDVEPRLFVVPIFILERSVRSVLLSDAVLLRR